LCLSDLHAWPCAHHEIPERAGGTQRDQKGRVENGLQRARHGQAFSVVHAVCVSAASVVCRLEFVVVTSNASGVSLDLGSMISGDSLVHIMNGTQPGATGYWSSCERLSLNWCACVCH